MMDPERLLAEQIPERYVAGRLSPREVAEFEEYLLEHPEVLQTVEVAHQLKLGLRVLSDRGTLAEMVQPKPPQPRRWLMAAAVAGLVLAGTVFTWLRQPTTPLMASALKELGPMVRSVPLAGEYMLVRTRSSELLEIPRPRVTAPIQIKVETLSAASAGFAVTLMQGEALISRITDAAPEPDGMLTVFLDLSALPEGDYILRVSDGSSTADHPFRILPARP
jgi:hypothetical protein